MALFIDRAVAEAVADTIINEPEVMYLCHIVPNFEAEWNKHTTVGTLGYYLYKYYAKQSGAYEEASPNEELQRHVRAYLILNMKPLFYKREGEFGRDLDETIQDFFRERGHDGCTRN